MTAELQKLVTELVLRDNLSSGLGRAMSSVSSFDRGVAQMGRGVGQVAGGLARLGTIAAGAALGGIAISVKWAADFEAQLNTINTIAQVTPGQLTDIGAGIRAMSRETGASLDDLTKGYYDLLSAGISVADSQKVLEQANLLATGSLGTTAQGVDVLTTAINAFRLNGSDAARVSEELAVAVERGKVTLDEIAPSYANVAQTAAVAGIGTDEIAAAYANLTAQGVPAAEVTTQMNRAILSLIAPNAELNDLQAEMGVNFAEIARDKGLVVALEELRKGAEQAGIPLLDLLGRQEAFKFTIATTGANLGRYNEDLAAVGNATGTLADQVGERRQGLAFQFAVLKANIHDIGITIGSALLPQLTPLVQEFTDFLQLGTTQTGIKDFAADLAQSLHDLVDAAKAGEFDGFISGLQLLGQVAKTAFDIFKGLPPEVQSLLVTGAALNRLSGGLLGRGVGNLAGGLLQIVFQRGSTPANPLFVAGVGGVGGVGGGVAGAAGGGAAGLVRNLAAIGIFTAVATAIGEVVAQNVTRPLNPTTFDFNAVAGQSGQFTTQGGAEQFAQHLALQLGAPLDEVKQGIVDAVTTEGLTFAQAVDEVRRDLGPAIRGGTDSTRRELGAGFASFRTHQAQVSAQRSAEAARLLQAQAATLIPLQQISLKKFGATVSVVNNNTVSVSASGVLSQTSTYAKIREG